MEEKTNELTNERKLATLARIAEIKEIPEAENIEHARVRGWWVVVKKGEFKVGDLCVYAEVDSVFPDGLAPELAIEWKVLQKELSRAATEDDKNDIKIKMVRLGTVNTIPQFEFLRGSKFRIKTKKIFGEVSQGIVFPIEVLQIAGHFQSVCGDERWEELLVLNKPLTNGNTAIPMIEDEDVTEVLGVTQFVPPDPATMGGEAKGDMQNVGLLISDEERLENLNSKYEIMKQFKYYKTEKLEGTSFTAYLKNGVFGVTGRTIEFKVPEADAPIDTLNVYWKMAKKLNLEEKMRSLLFGIHDVDNNFTPAKNFAIQGELIGEGIQGNIYKLKGQEIRFYNAFLIDEQEYVRYDLFLVAMNAIGLQTVPILDDNYTLPEKAIELLEEADRTTTIIGNNAKQLIEGFVYVAKNVTKGTKVTRSPFNRLSFKAKSRTYDMKKE